MKILSNDRIRFAFHSCMEARGADIKTEERLAVEVNFGHEASSTINRYYAKPDTEKRGRIIRNIILRGSTNLSTASQDDLLAELARRFLN